MFIGHLQTMRFGLRAATSVLDAIDVPREMNMTGARKVLDDAPISFVKAARHHRRGA